MQINISFNVINFLGVAVCALLAGYVGNIIGLVASIPLNRNRPTDERVIGFAVGFGAMTAMTPIKIVIASVVSAVAIFFAHTTTQACIFACIATVAVSMLFSLLTQTGRN